MGMWGGESFSRKTQSNVGFTAGVGGGDGRPKKAHVEKKGRLIPNKKATKVTSRQNRNDDERKPIKGRWSEQRSKRQVPISTTKSFSKETLSKGRGLNSRRPAAIYGQILLADCVGEEDFWGTTRLGGGEKLGTSR